MRFHHFRCGSLLAMTVLMLSGCSWGPSGAGQSSHSAASPSRASAICQWNPASCMYRGSYEPGEDVYAEQEAARLNRAEAARLGRRLY